MKLFWAPRKILALQDVRVGTEKDRTIPLPTTISHSVGFDPPEHKKGAEGCVPPAPPPHIFKVLEHHAGFLEESSWASGGDLHADCE
eukprot:scaffold323607_cov15-Tisochrysis_lutea.AAC.1